MGITVDNGVEPSRCLLHAVMRGLLDWDVVCSSKIEFSRSGQKYLN